MGLDWTLNLLLSWLFCFYMQSSSPSILDLNCGLHFTDLEVSCFFGTFYLRHAKNFVPYLREFCLACIRWNGRRKAILFQQHLVAMSCLMRVELPGPNVVRIAQFHLFRINYVSYSPPKKFSCWLSCSFWVFMIRFRATAGYGCQTAELKRERGQANGIQERKRS